MAGLELTGVTPEGWQRGRGYSHGMQVTGGSNVLFVAGQLAVAEGGDAVVSHDFVDQWGQCLANVRAVVESAGGRMDQVGAMQIFVTDQEEFLANRPNLGEAHVQHLGRHYPAMTLLEVPRLLIPGAKIEMAAMVVVD